MTIADEEIRPQPTQVERDLADGVGAIDQAEDFLSPARFDQGLKRESDTGDTDDGVEDGDLDVQALAAGGGDGVAESPHDLGVGDGEVVLDLDGAQRRRLRAVGDRVLDGAVHGVEVDEDIAWRKDEVVQDGVHARRRVLHEDDLLGRRMEQCGQSGLGFGEQLPASEADEEVRSRLRDFLKRAERIADGAGICPV